jgi:arylsulfatase A-like enzyme
VILISIDALRADRLGCYDYDRETTPSLDRMAEEGILFEQASAPGSWTVPSHASLLTGLYPRSHGMRYTNSRLPEEIVTLATILADHGYATGAIVNVNLLSQKRGFERGFDEFRSILASTEEDGSAEQINTYAIDWLERNSKRPFFLFLHYYDVHSDYRALPQYQEMFSEPYSGIARGGTDLLKRHRRGEITLGPQDARHLSNLYDASVRQLDDVLARLFVKLKGSGLLDRTADPRPIDHARAGPTPGAPDRGARLARRCRSDRALAPGNPDSRRRGRG